MYKNILNLTVWDYEDVTLPLGNVRRPVTSKRALKLRRMEKKVQAKINKNRAKRMEREIAKDLGGIRTPSSGAMQFAKGDVTVELASHLFYLIECKVSSRYNEEGYFLRLNAKWLYKIAEEAKYMNKQFGVLIMKFLYQTHMFVVIPVYAYRKYFGGSIDHTWTYTMNHGSMVIYYTPTLAKLPILLQHDDSQWYIIPYHQFKEMTKNYES